MKHRYGKHLSGYESIVPSNENFSLKKKNLYIYVIYIYITYIEAFKMNSGQKPAKPQGPYTEIPEPALRLPDET